MDNKTFIYFTWMPRTGGTFIWQVLIRIFPSKKICTSHQWKKADNRPVLITYRDFRDVVASWWRIRWGKYNLLGELINAPTKKQLEGAIDGIQKIILHFNASRNYYKNRENILWLRYEDFFRNYKYLFGTFEKFFNITISKELKEKIIQETNIRTNRKIQKSIPIINKECEFSNYDLTTKIHSHHIYTGEIGSWERIIPKEYHNYLNEKLKKDLKEWDYKV